MDSPFWHYQARFDVPGIIRRYAAGPQEAKENYALNYFGVVIDPKFFPEQLQKLAGTVEVDVIPANWHADMAEFGAALRAIDLSGDTFTVVELGCHWGCWINITGVAARRSGKKVRAIGIEGEPNHAAFALESTATNGFKLDEVRIHHGVVAPQSGTAFFPPEGSGLDPIINGTAEEQIQAANSGLYHEIPAVGFSDLIEGINRVDLLHIDIQGGEANLVSSSLDFLNEHVAYMMIGTHSRVIEGRLCQELLDAGWQLEVERPAIMDVTDAPVTRVDGVQGWRNPRLTSQTIRS
ncbi:FkbM family methyltransferase [Novosphingobium sp. PhB57]|uniref:FkbM family methyltransferase n=1 Tax=Novosphingobium sp. PhB57 TaxID=2485107 RepID=UPI0010488C42|nr:FkbM family methyltransferase [Novosphingobium sp. PhB57]TCU55719.1 FkbM family methyltransferase [Novosphingobium sp. PhB57]